MSITVTDAQQINTRLEDIKESINIRIEDIKKEIKGDIFEVKELIRDHLKSCDGNMSKHDNRLESLDDRIKHVEENQYKYAAFIGAIAVISGLASRLIFG